jgi:pimeloyl-ACP methyl ester carboxylesterase
MRVIRCAFDYFNRTGSLPAAVFDRDAVTNQAAEVLGTVGTFHGHEGWLELIENAGHWPWLDRPDVIDAAASFLRPSA